MTDIVTFIVGISLLVTAMAIGYEAGHLAATRRMARARRATATAIRLGAQR